MSGRTYHIGEVAERVGLSLRTVRYYEEMGLLSPEGRTHGGFRLYTEAHVDRLTLIRQMKPLGFSVAEMSDLLAARDRLANRRLSDSTREASRARLAAFADLAADRCQDLRGRLETAEGFARQMAREARSARPAPARG